MSQADASTFAAMPAGVLLAGSDLQVRNAVPMSNLASWAVDGDNFKIQRIAPALGRIFVDTFLTGFEQAQRLQVRE